MLNNYPLVSIVIPVYNGANYMKEAIDSALSQTYKNIEIIVVNDGSTDNTEEIALSYGDKIRYFKKENGGSSSALNFGINKMRGDYFSWLSHDDLYFPNKIEKEISLLDSDIDIVLCDGVIFYNSEKVKYKNNSNKIFRYDNLTLIKKFVNGFGFNGLGFLIHKKVFEKVGLFNEQLRYINDIDMWLRVMWYKYNFIYTTEKLTASRVHISQQSNIIKDVFYKESHFLTLSHVSEIEKLNDTNVYDKDKILIMYYYMKIKALDFKTSKFILSKMHSNKLKTRVMGIKYLLKGCFIRIARKIKQFVYNRRNLRS